MVNPIQDNQQASAAPKQEQAGRIPGPVFRRAPESHPIPLEIPSADGPRDLGALALALGLLAAACVIFWLGLYLPNHVAVRVLAASFGTFGIVWLLVRLRVFHRPHGGLIAVGVVALFAASVPFIERAFQQLDKVAKVRLAGEPSDAGKEASVPQVPPPPVSPAETKTEAPPVEDIVREFIAPAPDPSMGKLIRLVQDAQVTIGGRKFLIRSGSQFPFKRFADGNVTFAAGDQELTISSELVAFTGQSQETPAEITKMAMEELKKRYPKVFEKGTEENNIFVDRTRELKVELPEFFANARWPLEMGAQLAAQHSWRRTDKPEEDVPEPPPIDARKSEAPLPPADVLPQGETPLPDLPQMAPR